MDDKYQTFNIKGKYVEVQVGYFTIKAPVEFQENIINGELAPAAKVFITLSDHYNKNVVEPFLKKEKERKAAEEEIYKARLQNKNSEVAPGVEILTEPEQQEDLPIDDEIPDGDLPQEEEVNNG